LVVAALLLLAQPVPSRAHDDAADDEVDSDDELEEAAKKHIGSGKSGHEPKIVNYIHPGTVPTSLGRPPSPGIARCPRNL
jgi:hypothetical protein